jgi:hypothetical protein
VQSTPAPRPPLRGRTSRTRYVRYIKWRARARVDMTDFTVLTSCIIVVRLVIAKTQYSGHKAKLGQVFPVCHPGDERGANSPTEDVWCTYSSYALCARVLNLACGARWCGNEHN